MQKKLLMIDDDRLLCHTVSEALADLQIDVTTAHSGGDGLNHCKKAAFDVVLLDQKLPDGRGIDLCKPILKIDDRTKIIFITAYPSYDNAVQAIKVGADDYLSKPFELGELRLAVNRAMRTLDLEQVEQFQHYKSKREGERAALVGQAQGLREVRQMVDLAAFNQAPVLITGETGTGKTMVAKALHYRGAAARRAFIRVNCAAIPENLMEAELFGYEKGAFTGAVAAAKGLFEMASGGSLFLDEIGEIPRHLQSKLLGVLDDQKVKRLGGQTLTPVDVRVIAATNANLEQAISQGTFREDLYYRLSVVRIHVPPLRHRLEDLGDLCRHFIHDVAPDRRIDLSPDELRALAAYAWPGNVRELRNVIERAVLMGQGGHIRPSRLLRMNGTRAASPAAGGPAAPIMTLRAMEDQHIRQTLERLQGNHTQTARSLGISRSTLIRKLKALDSGSGIPKSDSVAN